MGDFLIVAGEPRRLEVFDDLRSPQFEPLRGGGVAALAVRVGEDHRRAPVVAVLGPDGDALGPALELPSGPPGTWIEPEIAALSDGGFVVSWLSAVASSDPVATLQLFDAAGRPRGDPSRAFEPIDEDETLTSMVATPTGFALLTLREGDWWNVGGEQGSAGLHLFDTTGTPLGAPRTLPFDDPMTSATLREAPDGGLVVTTNFGYYDHAPSIARLDAAGELVGPPREVDPRGEHGIGTWTFVPTPLADQRTLLTFPIDDALFAAMVSEEGELEGLPLRLGEGQQWSVRWSGAVALPEDGGAVVLWENDYYDDNMRPTYSLQRLDADGAPVGDVASLTPPYDGHDFRLQGLRAVGPGEIEVIWTTRGAGGQWHSAQTLLTEEAPGVTAGGVGDDVLSGTVGDDVLAALAGDDVMRGHGGSDEMSGGLGDDRMLGGAGDDRLRGGSGEDRMHGQGSDDHLFGDAGMDRLYGGAGDDRLAGGGGDDRLKGGTGDDVILWGEGFDRAWGGDGADRFVFGAADFDNWGYEEEGSGTLRILDFEPGRDVIVLDPFSFGTEDPAEFARDHIVVREDRAIIEPFRTGHAIQIEGETDALSIASSIELL